MAGHIELLLRAIAAAVALPASDGTTALIVAGVVGLAGGAIVLVARSVLALVAASSGATQPELTAAATDIPLVSTQSDPDAAGRPRPRAPEPVLPAAGL